MKSIAKRKEDLKEKWIFDVSILKC